MVYRVDELAASSDLSVDTIRYYQKLGLLAFEHDKAAPDLTTHEVLAA